MADADYQRLGAACHCEDQRSARATPHACKQCGAAFVGTLRQKFCRKSCNTDFHNAKQKVTLVEHRCGDCGADFIGLAKRAKCNQCWRSAQGRSSLSKPLNTHTCSVCSIVYQTKASRSSLCSGACKVRAHYLRKGRVVKPRSEIAEAAANKAAALRHTRAAKAVERAASAYWAAEMAELQRSISGKCNDCGQRFHGVSGKRFCSECSLSRQRATKHAARIARKAILKAAKVDRVDPFKVFDRDDWTCYLCGCSTPRSLRGTYEDAAPEVEHVVPITRGGKDAYDNVRCACRKCNLIKSDFLLDEIGGAFA